MKKAVLILIFLIFLQSCEKPKLIDSVVIDYIDELEKELGSDYPFNIFIEEIERDGKTIYRINSADIHLTRDNLPYDYDKRKMRYIFKFNDKKKIHHLVLEELENEKLFIASTSYFNLEDFPEWILIICDNNRYFLYENGGYRPIEQIQEIQDFQC